MLPDKICLIVDKIDEEIVPEQFLINPLIEIIYSDINIKSHNKYYHTMCKYPNDVIITIDDDVIYPQTFIEDCINAYTKFPTAINAGRVHKIKYNDGKLLPYKLWEWDYKGEYSPDLFFTGVGGVVYPPKAIVNLLNIDDIKKYLYVDDILLNALCRKSKIKIRRIPIRNSYKDINLIPFKLRLCTKNVIYNNDLFLNKIEFIKLLKSTEDD
jgi:hypothetical protein